MKMNQTATNDLTKAMNNTTKEMMSFNLVLIDQYQFPLVATTYEGKNGQTYHGVFVIDSGATNCQLSKTILKRLDEKCFLDESLKITGIQGEGSECRALDFDFELSNGLSFSERFFASAMEMDFLGKGIVTGILGIDFLRKHNLVLDFESKTLHTATEDEVKVEDCDFFFGMEFGINAHTVPLVPFVNGDDMFFLIVDSGANVTTITKHAMQDSEMLLEDYKEDSATIDTVTGTINAGSCRSTINLVSLKNGGDGIKVMSLEDKIHVLPEVDFIVNAGKNNKGEDTPPVSGMLSSSFMLRNKWILDFHTGVIYSRKKAA